VLLRVQVSLELGLDEGLSGVGHQK